MKNILLLFAFLISSLFCSAQFFQATIQKGGNDLIFIIRPNPSGEDITTQWSDIEFFVRWPDGSDAFNFGEIIINTADFPNIRIPNNGINIQGEEEGYTNNWFGTSFSSTPSRTYSAGVEYEVFRVTLDVPASSIDFQLVHNDQFFPHYLALIDGSGSDLTNVAGNMFFSENARICPSANNCPVSTSGSNHVDEGENALLPVELIDFTASKIHEEVLLTWETAVELNNQGFDIERRNDSGAWAKLGYVAGNGTTTDISRYKFVDYHPKNGTNYYRLKQLDRNGQFEYSSIRLVNFEKIELGISVFPNPVHDVINIAFTQSHSNVQVELIDQFGSVVMKKLFSNSAYTKTFNVNHIPKGVYFISILHEDRRTVEKIILQ